LDKKKAKYEVKTEIKKDIKYLGIAIKCLSHIFGEAPITTTMRLNGWLLWEEKHSEKANKLINFIKKEIEN